jgi:chromosome segregation ATPase
MDNNLLVPIIVAAIAAAPGILALRAQKKRDDAKQSLDQNKAPFEQKALDADATKALAESVQILIDPLNDELNKLREQLASYDQENNALKNEIETVTRRMNSMAHELDLVKAENRELRRANSLLQSSVSKLSAQVLAMGGKPVVEPPHEGSDG